MVVAQFGGGRGHKSSQRVDEHARLGEVRLAEARQQLERAAEQACRAGNERERLVSEVLDETFGLGPLELLLKDPTISGQMPKKPPSVRMMAIPVPTLPT